MLHQILNPLIFILIAVAAASVAIGETTDTIFILLLIVLNSGLGAYQEYNAEKSAAGLQKLLKINARVQRSGVQTEIPAENLAPGDIVFLEPGNKVPADLRLLDASGLTADESFGFVVMEKRVREEGPAEYLRKTAADSFSKKDMPAGPI